MLTIGLADWFLPHNDMVENNNIHQYIQVYMYLTYVMCSNDFALYLEDYLIYEYHTWDTGSMWHQDLF